MTVNYTSLLGLALPVTGTEAGAWGDVVNNYLTSYLDASVAGTQTITGSQTAVTLAVTNGATLVTVGSGATGSAQFQIITCTGNPASLLTITAPASSRQYIIINSTSTSQSVKIVGAGPTTGVTIVSGEKAHVAWNGSDFVKIATQNGNGDFVTVDTTNLEVTNIKAKDGTASMTLADSTGVVTFSANPVLNAGTAYGVPYLSSPGKVLTTGSALTFDGSNFFGGTNTYVTGRFYAQRSSSSLNLAIAGYTDGSAGAVLTGTKGDIVAFGNVGGDGVIFANANTEQMRLTSTGLGIGTNNPTTKLYVTVSAASTACAAFFNTDTANGNGVYIKAGGANAGKYALAIENAASSSLLYLDSSGNLGLGVTPSANSGRLQVQGENATTSYAGVPTASLLDGNANGEYSILRFATSSDGSLASIAARASTGGAYPSTVGALEFAVQNGASSTLAMTLLANGNLGVGETNPGWKLQVNGSAGVQINNANAAEFHVNNTSTSARDWVFISSGSSWAGGGQTGYFNIYDNTASAQRLTIDTSGNVGIGTNNPTQKLDVRAAAGGIYLSSTTGTNQVALQTNNSGGDFYFGIDNSAGNNFNTNTAYAGVLWRSGANPICFVNNSTEKMRLDSSGRLLVNATTATADKNGGVSPLQVRTNGTGKGILIQSVINNANEYTYVGMQYDNGNTNNSAQVRFAIDGSDTNTRIAFLTDLAGTLTERARISSDGTFRVKGAGTAGTTDAVQFSGSAPASAMTLDASGNLLVGPTSALSSNYKLQVVGVTSGNGLYYQNSTDGGNAALFVNAAGSSVGYISVGASATTYNTTSDYRLKNNQQALTGSGAFIDALKPKTWDWKSGGKGVGFIAHEVAEVSPGTVVGTKDAVDEEGKPIMQAMEYGSAEFIANIIAELQSLRARVAQLEQGA